MRVLVLSTVFPSASQPAFGVFIRERVRRLTHEAHCRVVSPLPWFPGDRLIRGPRSVTTPRVEDQDGLQVLHPRVLSIPRYAKSLDGFFYAASLAPRLARLRREFDFDLLDAHFAYPDGVAAVLLGRLFRRPVVITLRGSIVRLQHYALHRPQLRWALHRATRITAVSQSLKDVAVGLGVAPERIRVIPNGVDAERFRPRDRSGARQTLGLPEGRSILLSVGGLNEGKGHHHVVGLLPGLLRHRPDLLYVIVGGERPGDSTRPRIERMVSAHGLANHVLLAGERPHEQIPLWNAAADLFCLATRSEGWANVLLEALACGTPVVATRVGGNAEIVSHDGLGLLVPSGDDAALGRAILEALGRDWDTPAIVAHARRHSWETSASAVMEEWQAATDGGPAPALHARAAGCPDPTCVEPPTREGSRI